MDGTIDGTTKAAVGANGLAVDVKAVAAGTNIIGKVTTDQTTHGTTDLVAADLTKVAGSSIATGHGTAAGSVRVELPTDGTGLVSAAQSGTWTVQPGNTANTTAWKVDGSAVTQPVSGTVSITSNSAVNVAQINGVTTLMGAGNTGTGSQRVTIASDQAVLPVSDNAGSLTVDNGGTFAVQEATLDAALIAQEATTSGVKGVTAFGAVTTAKPTYTTAKSDALSLDTSGLLRVSLADTPANGTKLLVTPDSVALPANQSVNVAQVNGVTTLMGNGTTGTGSQRVTIASDNTAFGVNATLQTQTDTVMVGGVNVKEINAVTPLMGNGVTGTGSQRVTIASDNTVLPGVGAGATAAAVPANAVYNGGIATTANPTSATAGNTVGLMADKAGRVVVTQGHVRELVGTQTTTLSATTSETTIVTAGAAGVFNDIALITVANTSASTQTRIDFRDATAGSVIFSLDSPGNSTVGFAPPIPIPQTAAAGNWTAQCASSTTDVRIFVQYLKNK